MAPAWADGTWRGGPDAALRVWVAEQQEVTEDTFAFQPLLFLRHPDIQSDVWATPAWGDVTWLFASAAWEIWKPLRLSSTLVGAIRQAS